MTGWNVYHTSCAALLFIREDLPDPRHPRSIVKIKTYSPNTLLSNVTELFSVFFPCNSVADSSEYEIDSVWVLNIS
jgi:hypothetical protein